MTTVETSLARARAHERKGDGARARALCRDVLSRYPANARARSLMARLPEAGPPADILEDLMAAHNAGHGVLVAEQVARLLPVYPESYLLWELHGGVLLDLGACLQAEESLARAVDLRPDLIQARVNHVVALRAAGRLDEAEARAREVLKLSPRDAGARMELAAALADRGNLPEAAELCREIVAETPDVAVAQNILGVAALDAGHLAEATACYMRAIAIAPRFAEAHRNLARLKSWQAEDDQLAQMTALYEDPALSPVDRARICFGLFDAWHGLGQPDRALPFLEQGNALRKALLGYDISQDQALFERLADLRPAPLRDVPPAPVVPIFILGMPRSGTTLTEQIVSAHPQVTGAGELRLMGDLARPFLAGAEPTEEALRGLRERYLAGLAERGGGARFITDKMPHNFCFLPLICAALPEARIVHVVRDAPSVCWSNLRQYFSARSLGYCHDPDDVVAYHGLYRDWTARCEADWPGRVRRLDHSMLTEAPEAQIRALIADLGLEWDAACLAPQDNLRGVHTASAAQVRKPICTVPKETWAPYAPWVGAAFSRLVQNS